MNVLNKTAIHNSKIYATVAQCMPYGTNSASVA